MGGEEERLARLMVIPMARPAGSREHSEFRSRRLFIVAGAPECRLSFPVGSVSPFPPPLLVKALLLQPWSLMGTVTSQLLGLERALTVLLKSPPFLEKHGDRFVENLEKQGRP